MASFLDDFYRLLIDWCERTADEVDDWPDIRDVGLTERGRARFEQILAEPEP